MTDSAATLRRRVALYRKYLSEGVDADLARTYLAEIAKDEALLAEIEGGTSASPKPDDSPE